MIRSSRGKDFQAKQEGDDTNDRKLFKAPSSSRKWSAGFKNPRIIRVSRSFGGKDRHSKVCTVRGLRDRRIRLSVPTAIQLYDLQDRLGLNQPSKVIDWLLDVAKDDVDKLPPLQIPLGNLGQFLQPTLVSHDQSNASTQSSLSQFFGANSTFMKDGGSHSLLSRKEGIKINDNFDGGNQTIMPKSKHWYLDHDLKGKSKEVGSESIADQKTKWMKMNELENQDGIGGYNTQVSAQNYFPLANPYNSYYHWEASSNLSLSSQLGSQGFPISETDQYLHNSANAASQMPPPFAIPSGSQLFFCPPATTLPSLFPPYLPYFTAPLLENNLQVLNSTTSLMPSFHSINSPMKSFPPILNVNPMFLPLQSNNEHKANKNDTGP